MKQLPSWAKDQAGRDSGGPIKGDQPVGTVFRGSGCSWLVWALGGICSSPHHPLGLEAARLARSWARLPASRGCFLLESPGEDLFPHLSWLLEAPAPRPTPHYPLSFMASPVSLDPSGSGPHWAPSLLGHWACSAGGILGAKGSEGFWGGGQRRGRAGSCWGRQASAGHRPARHRALPSHLSPEPSWTVGGQLARVGGARWGELTGPWEDFPA